MRPRTSWDIDALNATAESWVGTPFCERSAVKGAGVCCHRLLVEVFAEAGWLPRIDVPDHDARWARAQSRSVIADWLDGAGAHWFVGSAVVRWDDVQAGDVLGFRLGRSLHHLVLALPHGRYLHTLEHGVVIAAEMPLRWCDRAERMWRPIPQFTPTSPALTYNR